MRERFLFKPANGKLSRRAKKQIRRSALLFLLSLSVLLLLTGCISQAEIDAARENSGAAQDVEPLEPLEGMDEAEAEKLNEDGGIVDKLLSMFGSRNQSLQIIALLTVLSLAPSILIMFTSFVRIIMVLSFTRNAMGLQQMPPNQVLVGLALFLTLFVMTPVINDIKTEAAVPYLAEQIELDEALDRGVRPIKTFMLERTRGSDLGMFYAFSQLPSPETEAQILETPLHIAAPAFLTSELRRAFEIGFFIYIPFIAIDMIVASTLMAMGMMMLPPITISMPFKVLLFVLVDGWSLTFETILRSFY